MMSALIVGAALYLACGYAAACDMMFPEDWRVGRLHPIAQFILIALIWPYGVYRVRRYGWTP